MIGKKEIMILEGKTGFLKTRLEKVYRLLEVLKEISRHPLLSKVLALKGGTAINLFIFDCPRLSIDLDFNFIGARSKEEADKARKEVASGLETIFRFFRYSAEPKSFEGMDQWFAAYETLFGGTDRIKVEVNYLLRLPLQNTAFYPVRSPFSMKLNVRALGFEEIFAAKCVALFDRVTPRDLFDVYQLNNDKTLQYDAGTLEKLFLFYASVSRSSIFDFKVNAIQELTEKEIKDQLWPLLSKEKRPTKTEMFKKVQPFLRGLLNLTANENKFFKDYYQGVPDFSLLFDNPELIRIGQEHPMTIWKQAHLTREKG